MGSLNLSSIMGDLASVQAKDASSPLHPDSAYMYEYCAVYINRPLLKATNPLSRADGREEMEV